MAIAIVPAIEAIVGGAVGGTAVTRKNVDAAPVTVTTTVYVQTPVGWIHTYSNREKLYPSRELISR